MSDHTVVAGRKQPRTRVQRMADAAESVNDHLLTGLAKMAFPLMGVVSSLAFYATYTNRTPGQEFWQWPDGRFFVSLTVFLVLAGFPSWLYLRFLSVKMSPIYEDYVLNLHRLGVDEPGYLPRPLQTSYYYEPWRQGREAAGLTEPGPQDPPDNIYDRKFEAYFGRRDRHERFTGMGSLLPVMAVWVAFSVGWLTILLNTSFVEGDVTYYDALRFAFMGAYLFSLQLTVRAFFQGDLRSGTYVGILERLVVVLILVTVIDVAWSALPVTAAIAPVEAVVVFVVGSFPLVGQEWLSQWAAGRMRTKVRTLESRHPLSDIDGMNVWYEARLLEEGIEDVQNLATASIVDVVLHSRAPVGRLVDWIDQALLRQHLPRSERDESQGKPAWQRRARELDEKLLITLEALGVRTATDLLELCSPLTAASAGVLHHDLEPLQPAPAALHPFHELMQDALGDEEDRQIIGLRILAILRSLGNEPNLRLVLNWQACEPPAAVAGGRAPAAGPAAPPRRPRVTVMASP